MVNFLFFYVDLRAIKAFDPFKVEFVNSVTGGMITSNFIKSVEKGVREACIEGALTGHKISGIRFTLRGGRTHNVDSSDWAFSRVGYYAIKEHFVEKATVLEPWMDIEVAVNLFLYFK